MKSHLIHHLFVAKHIGAMFFLGVASWFMPNQGDGPYCAMNLVRPGHYVHIQNLNNGRTAQCLVVGTGPFVAGRILDVSPSLARELGFYSAGTTSVKVTPE